MTSVAILGGGVAGLTAAHELIERGFSVTLYEGRTSAGGKARSQPVPGTGTAGRRDLPGEHGFRFYPSFYRHVIDTMRRTPDGRGGTVADALRPTTESAIAGKDDTTWTRFSRKRLTKPYEIVEVLELFFQDLDVSVGDVSLFTAKVLQFLTSCDARRDGEYEPLSWWQYLHGDAYGANFQKQLRAIPRTMVAMDPQRGSARTIGRISMQLLLDFAESGASTDRTMGGPTSEMWLDPWVDYLRDRGVVVHTGAPATAVHVGAGQVTGVDVTGHGTVTADHYVLAVPIDVVGGLISPALGALDPQLERLRTAVVDDLVSWMVGLQFFLYEDVPLVRGHLYYPDSPWALTTISQAQFWDVGGLFRRRYGDGSVGGIISVDISDWDTPGTYVGKPARLCTPAEVADEVWHQLKDGLNGAGVGEQILRDELLHSWHLDADLDYSGGVPPRNDARLLVHPPGSFAQRPTAASLVPNLVLAGDYVQTGTDLASMEGANEAARRAINAVLDRAGWVGPRAGVWALEEPRQFAVWKRLDAALHARGKRHLFELLGLGRADGVLKVMRTVSQLTGLDRLDDAVDHVHVTELIDRALRHLGLIH